MLTARGFWFFVPTLALLTAALYLGAVQLTLICLTLIIWFLGQWFLFQLRVRLTVPKLSLERRLHTPRGEVESIWARQPVRVTVTLSSHGALPYVVMTERVPALARVREGNLRR